MESQTGPYIAQNGFLSYKGSRLFSPLDEVRKIPPPDLEARFGEVQNLTPKWQSLIKLYDAVFKGTVQYMEGMGCMLFDLPITTRMISSPGALSGTIPSDVHPFEIDFFGQATFLTQSSQLYLEFALCCPGINKLYCWEKSFRRERSDHRHLPEFTHVEFEANIAFDENLKTQTQYLQQLISYVLKTCAAEILIFLSEDDILELEEISRLQRFQTISFHEAFALLFDATRDQRYKNPTVANFGAYEEVLLTQLMNDQPVFVTHYLADEVAFYHGYSLTDPRVVLNADLLFPGYGELIGSGERVRTREDLMKKADQFLLNKDDYAPYIYSRDYSTAAIHSGWGMGIERFLQSLLKLPFIWDTKLFPRVDNSLRP